ncbi:hypothetical protein SY88_14885 [Clostridiales bacterium PH28_bin88]|nr:hypothetical protein SY88_14885 [Clostridiales bacterium PH28_bin88]
MANGRLRKVFPGGNTSVGFYSFYEHIIPPDARRIMIIKGGPGVGKSTLMRVIGDAMLEKGFDLEHHCCSSDNGSLDGVVIPAIGVAMIDGTAPHIVDPKNPGAVDEIIHLGDYWDETGMRANKEQILKLNREVGRLFRRAYGYLAQAKILLDEVESYYIDGRALDVVGLNSLANTLVSEIFSNGPQLREARARHLFASAISPGGLVNHFETLFDHLQKRYIITGDDGTGKSTIVKKVYDTAVGYGYDVEAFHCALAPDRIEHLIIPSLDIAVISSMGPHRYPARDSDAVIHTARFVSSSALASFTEDMGIAKRRYQEAIDRAVSLILRAKLTHDEMEEYYVPNMDFEAINALRDATLRRILAYAEEVG